MISAKCQQCGFVNRLADETCHRCGAELSGSAENPAQPAFEYPRAPAAAEIPEVRSEELELIPAIGQFEIGSAIGQTVELFKDNIWLITKIVVLVFAPLEIFKSLSFSSPGTTWQTVTGTFLLGLFCKALVAPSLIYALMVVMRTGVSPSLNECYRWGLSRLGKLAACALLAGALETLGLICLIIPGIILGVAFELVYPMAALENRTPVEILKRSYQLTKGYRWRIFWATLVVGLLAALANIPTGIVAIVLVANGINFWPLNAGLTMVNDILNESTTVLSFVIYLSIVTHTPADDASATSPLADPRWR
jgi:uncharacterized membrane protein